MEISDYEINSSTLIILPLDEENSRVYELENDYIVHKSCFSIMKDSCIFFGSSFFGRLEMTKSLINCKMKLPVIVEENKNMIFFPTSSFKNSNCVWISFKNLIKYTYNDKFSTVLFFKKNRTIQINIKYNIIDNQVIRCIKLETMWNKRKNDFNDFW